MKLQRGGTLLGFILGVVVGLGLALGVAMYVTKVPVPFMNKGQSRTPEQDEQESRKNKDWDPNAGLYGKNPARPASAPAPADAAKPDGKSDTKPDGKGNAKPEAKPETKADAKPDAKAPSKDALGDLAKAKAGASADPFIYFVQTGAYRTPEDAEAQRAKLLLLGVDAKVSERDQSGHMVYRVRLGPFDVREDADRAKDKLDSNHQDAVLVRVQR